jgi:hypothetical protein
MDMNVGFVGAPCSGKTTTAAFLFAQMKKDAVTAEFVSEYARYHIARQRWLRDLKQVVLSDEDQYKIMQKQWEVAEAMHHSVGRTGVVISDASPLGALSYMSERGRNSDTAYNLLQKANASTDLLFFAYPFEGYEVHDPNRIHTVEQARVIHNEIPDLLARFSPGVPVIHLYGDILARQGTALRAIYDRLPV